MILDDLQSFRSLFHEFFSLPLPCSLDEYISLRGQGIDPHTLSPKVNARQSLSKSGLASDAGSNERDESGKDAEELDKLKGLFRSFMLHSRHISDGCTFSENKRSSSVENSLVRKGDVSIDPGLPSLPWTLRQVLGNESLKVRLNKIAF